MNDEQLERYMSLIIFYCRCVLYRLLLVSRQLEQQAGQNSSEKTEMLRRLSGLQEDNTRLSWDKASLADCLKRTQCELEREKQANRYQIHSSSFCLISSPTWIP